jgi:hypothetical protein
MKNDPVILFVRSLEKILGLEVPLCVNDSKRVSLVLNDTFPILLNLSYDTDNKKITLSSPLCFALPSNINGLQNMMTRLFPDLLVMKKEYGRLVADANQDRIDLVKDWDAENPDYEAFTKFVPLFISQIRYWRKKVSESLEDSPESFSPFNEEEILNFSYPTLLTEN